MANDAAGLRLVLLGFVAIIAIAGLVLLFTQTGRITGQVSSSYYRITENPIITRTPYEACRALRTGNGLVPEWDMVVNPKTTLIKCVDPTDPTNALKAHYVELQTKHG
jgi:hypothetical protein